jgi:non-specific serine/threonine protein kinase/serine/threonine-protein kinase
MATPTWDAVKRILQSALEQSTERRSRFLDEACGGDTQLRSEVDSLLAVHDAASEFLERPALEDEREYERLGPWRIVEEISHGGMGRVFRAVREDGGFTQQVAVKLIKRGMDSGAIVRRFHRERQLLAELHHPNIARLIDGGETAIGQPYLVMELVDGVPIDRFVEERRLRVRDILVLFRAVCAAVQHAHERLVVHRDIKPSNVLVTSDGVPKLLDFGIARLLTPDSDDATATLDRVFTPEYASPEQIRGTIITTASDIYSLGVLLYRLIAKRQPYSLEGKAPHEASRVVCEQDPPPPSSQVDRDLRRDIAGDLDNIVATALRKAPDQRYRSAEHLSEDIRRYLEGLPVSAHRSSVAYRVRKFVGRHRALVVTAVLAIVSVLAAAGIAVREAQVARIQRDRAERNFADVRRLANSYLFEFHDAVENLPGSTRARELLVQRALEYLDRLARESRDDAQLSRELAVAYQRVGDVQGRPLFANLGDTHGALASYRKAETIRQHLFSSDSNSYESKRGLLVIRQRIGAAQLKAGDLPGALSTHREALSFAEQIAAAEPARYEALLDLGISYDQLGRSRASASILKWHSAARRHFPTTPLWLEA